MKTTTATGARQERNVRPKRVSQARAPGIISQNRIIKRGYLVYEDTEEILQTVSSAAENRKRDCHGMKIMRSNS